MKYLERIILLFAVMLGVGMCPVMAQDCKQVKLAANQIKVTQANISHQDGLMVMTLKLNLDSLLLPTNMRLVYTPMLISADSTLLFPRVIVNGRRQQIMYERSNAKGNKVERQGNYFADRVVRRENGKPQELNYQFTLPIDNGLFADYDFKIHEDLCGCGDLQDGNDILLLSYRHPEQPACDRTSKSELADREKALRIFHLDKRCYIDFPVDQTQLYVDYHRNAAQLDSIVNTIRALKEDSALEVVSINIHGFASPESSYQHNAYLAEHRAKAILAYVRCMVNLPDSVFSVSSTAEDWEGLRSYIQDSNLEHKTSILAIAQDESLKPDEREAKIKKLYPSEYRFMLNTWYPYLRHTDYHIAYRVKRVEEVEVNKVKE